jgi:hypothetical protein
MALMALLNSVSRVDYFIFYLPAFAALVQYQLEQHPLGAWFPTVVIASLVLLCGINEWTLGSNDWNHRLEGWRIPVFGMLMLCFLLGWTIRQSRLPARKLSI